MYCAANEDIDIKFSELKRSCICGNAKVENAQYLTISVCGRISSFLVLGWVLQKFMKLLICAC